MLIHRRRLMGTAAAVLAAAATSACVGEEGDAPPTTETAPRRSRTVGRGSRSGQQTAFPGAPRAGHLYFGATVPHYRSVTGWEEQLGATLSVHRSYFVPVAGEVQRLTGQCRDDLANDRLPHVSIKPPGTWRDSTGGPGARWLDGVLRSVGELDGPVLLTLHHEPENDAGGSGMEAADWVALQRHAIARAADLAPLVTIAPVLQSWTFNPLQPGNDPSAWDVPEAAVFGIDVYNPWSPTNGRMWRSFASKLEDAMPWVGDRPIVIGEYGCRQDPEDPGRAAAWIRAAAEDARSLGVVAMSYFNSTVNVDDGEMELVGQSERTFASLLGSGWVARVDQVSPATP
ncbi:hypothetical protein [Nocardioides sp. YIM 152588]|uniref:hypothetical protein n=1 Tax=Nocardioides sp. YIM 152588 TaxID=3158259 RepID=UPI0032E3B101